MIRRFITALERIADALEALVIDDKQMVKEPPVVQGSNPLPPGKLPKDDDDA